MATSGISGVKAELDHVNEAQPAIAAAMTAATHHVSQVGAALDGVPGAADLVKAAMTYASQLGEAITEISGSLNGMQVLAPTQGGTYLDDAKIKAGLAKLRTALPMKPLMDPLEQMFTNKDLIDRIKQRFAGQYKSGDFTTVHEALKQVHPGNVLAFKHLSNSLKALETHQKVAAAGATQASVQRLESELRAILDDFCKDIQRLVDLCDKFVTAFE